MLQWGDLFTARQKLALATLARLVYSAQNSAVSELLGLVLNGVVDRNAVLATWRPQADQEKVEHVFARQALPMSWDFAEAACVSESTGSWEDRITDTVRIVSASCRQTVASAGVGQVQQADATEHPLPDETAQVWFTDPPYYDAVPYADLSDFFLVWLKRALPGHPLLRDPFDPANPLTPKAREAVQNERCLVPSPLTPLPKGEGNAVSSPSGRGWREAPGEGLRPKDKAFYEEAMARAFAEGRRVLREDGVGSVVFAHKTTEGWEALLSGLIKGGWTITGSWPIATEMASRLRARDSAALATSIHLICRPRVEEAVGDWSAVSRKLPRRVRDWMKRLQSEGVRGADLVFACIGPALEIYSRYKKVETADGRAVKLDEYLAKVWEVVGRSALEQVLGTAEAKARNGAAGAVEEDARLTALFLWTLQSTNGVPHPDPLPEGEGEELEGDEEEEDVPTGKAKGYSLVFDVVRRFAQPLGIELPRWEGRIIETQKGVVRLMGVSERARQLFGDDGAEAVADWIVEDPQKNLQHVLFSEMEQKRAPRVRGQGRRRKALIDPGEVELQKDREATTLDRVHAAMLLQAGGQTNALRALIKAEMERGPDFLRLANALSALYPKGSEEKRLLAAMLLAVPR